MKAAQLSLDDIRRATAAAEKRQRELDHTDPHRNSCRAVLRENNNAVRAMVRGSRRR